MSITATYLSSAASIVDVSITDLSAAVGDAAYSLSMVDRGNKQRGTIDKEDATSPTAALESVLLTSTIDAAEERYVAVIDIHNAFIQTRIKNDEDKVVLFLRGKLADLLIETAPEIYRKHITINRNGETVLYVRALHGIYSIAALLFYQNFVGDLMTIGFKLNPYDPCVANKTINGKELTLVWKPEHE